MVSSLDVVRRLRLRLIADSDAVLAGRKGHRMRVQRRLECLRVIVLAVALRYLIVVPRRNCLQCERSVAVTATVGALALRG